MTLAPRLILLHKQSTSARVRFLKLDHGGVCMPEPLPKLSTWIEGGAETDMATLPGPLLKNTAAHFDLRTSDLELEKDYREQVDTPEGTAWVYLARFTAMDPPFEAVEAKGAKFIAITEARGMAEADLELLRKAYETVLG